MSEYRMSSADRRIGRKIQVVYAVFGVPALIAAINAFVPGFMFGVEYPEGLAPILGIGAGLVATVGIVGSYAASSMLDKS